MQHKRASRSFQRGATFHAHRLITVGGKRAENFFRVGAVARLHGDVELGSLGRHVEKQAVMIDAQNVGAEFAEAARRCGPGFPDDPGW